MTDRELMQQVLDALSWLEPHCDENSVGFAKWADIMPILRERLAQPEPVIDKSAARRIATALGWVPPGDTSQERVDEAGKQRREQEPVVKWDASAPLVVTPHPAFQATPPCREWVGLTEEEIKALPQWFPSHETAAVIPLIRAVEAKLREKNNG